MADNREQQDVLLVVVSAPANEKDSQEVLLVIGPSLTVTTPAAGTRPQVCVNT